MRSVIASPCCTRARSGRWEPWSKSSRRRIPWSGSSLRDAPGEARERVRRRPRRDRGVRGRGRRRLVALGCPHRSDGGGLHRPVPDRRMWARSEEHTSELQSLAYLVCRLLLEKKKMSDINQLAQSETTTP